MKYIIFCIITIAFIAMLGISTPSMADNAQLLTSKVNQAKHLFFDAGRKIVQLHKSGVLPGIDPSEELSDGKIDTSENQILFEKEIYPKYFIGHWVKLNSDDRSVYTYLLVKVRYSSEWKLKSAWHVTPSGRRSKLTLKNE